MPAPMTLRLLAAARHAYQITGDKTVPNKAPPKAPDPYGTIGYVLPPLGVRAGLFNQDAGLVGAIPEGVVVAIRGTTPPRPGQDLAQLVVDWALDAVADLEPSADHGFPGEVHFGFYKSFMRLWDKLNVSVRAAVTAHSSKTIFVTGHSKGGAICPLVAWRLKTDFPDHQIVVRAFAPARIGDQAFANSYNAKITDHVRYEYDDDIVPHLPLETALAKALGAPTVAAALLSQFDPGYADVGVLGYIKSDGSIVGASPELARDRVMQLLTRLSGADGLAYVARCHGIDLPTDGYVRARYPDLV
jgi:hypothetical protein